MHRRIVVAVAILALSAGGMAGCKKQQQEGAESTTAPAATAPQPATTQAPVTSAGGKTSGGEQLYKQYCVACHPDGGNTINPKKTLHHADMVANKVTSADDVVKLMRNPGPGMNKFDDKMIPDTDAKAIGQYILDTYK
jgi:cytochrome c6